MNPSPVIGLNHAVAVAMPDSFERSLAMVDQLGAAPELVDCHLYRAARVDLQRRLGRAAEAGHAYMRALELMQNRVEQEYPLRRLAELQQPTR